jgi:hypothetical protein
VLIHEVTNQIGRARGPSRPYALLIGGNQSRLRLEPGYVRRISRFPKPINQCASASEFRL